MAMFRPVKRTVYEEMHDLCPGCGWQVDWWCKGGDASILSDGWCRGLKFYCGDSDYESWYDPCGYCLDCCPCQRVFCGLSGNHLKGYYNLNVPAIIHLRIYP